MFWFVNGILIVININFAWSVIEGLLLTFVMRVSEYSKDCCCFNLVPSTQKLPYGAVFYLITTTSVFLTFKSSPFSLFSLSTPFNKSWRSYSFSAINTASTGYLRQWVIFSSILILGMFCSCLGCFSAYIKKSVESTQPCLPLFYFLENHTLH